MTSIGALDPKSFHPLAPNGIINCVWWAFGSGVAIGLVVGAVGAGIWLVPALMRIVANTIETASRSIRFPRPTQILDPFSPPPNQDPYATLENDNEQVPDWMNLDEEETNA